MSIAVGFADGRALEYDCSRERVLRRPEGIAGLACAAGQKLIPEGGLPDLCAAVRLSMDIAPRSQRSATLLISAAVSPDQAVNQLLRCRGDRLEPSQGALSPCTTRGSRAGWPARCCPRSAAPPATPRQRLAAARENRLGIPALWSLGISGDLPIAVVELHGAGDLHIADNYLGVLLRLRRCSLLFDLVFLYREGGEYDKPVRGGVEQCMIHRGAEDTGRPAGRGAFR